MAIKSKSMICTAAVILGLGLFSGGTSVASDAGTEDPTAGAMFVDAVAVRPMTLAASAGGFAAWVVPWPFSIPSGSAADAGKSWVVDPLEYTFVRPLGDISDNR